MRRETTDRRERLLSILAALQTGDPVDRNAILDVTMAIIEDAHSSEPLLFGEDVAAHFARLHAARTGLRSVD